VQRDWGGLRRSVRGGEEEEGSEKLKGEE